MTKSALWNLQHGVPEDRRYPYTTYIPENAIDNLVLSHIQAREQAKQYFDKRAQEQAEKELAERVAKEIAKQLDKICK